MEERKQVIQAILELDCIPVGMELFPAANEDQWTLIKELIDDCDYYVRAIGGRYGSLSKEGISYTQKEYEYAVESGIPTISFLHKRQIPYQFQKLIRMTKNESCLKISKPRLVKK